MDTPKEPLPLRASGLLGDLRRHISIMAPHQKDRMQGRLLIDAATRIHELEHALRKVKEGMVGVQNSNIADYIDAVLSPNDHAQRTGRITQDFMNTETSLPSEPPVRCIRLVMSPSITVIHEGRWWRKPLLWLMCPYPDKPGMAFQVGEFRDWQSASLALERLTELLKTRQAA